jgi:hypothetical protein
MKKYFIKNSKEEIRVGGELHAMFQKDKSSTRIEIHTDKVDLDLIEKIAAMGFLDVVEIKAVNNKPSFYIKRCADRLNMNVEEFNALLTKLKAVYPNTVFQLLLREIALEMDNTHQGNIRSVEPLYIVNSINGNIVKTKLSNEDRKRDFIPCSLFRSEDEAKLACGILGGLYYQIFKKCPPKIEK